MSIDIEAMKRKEIVDLALVVYRCTRDIKKLGDTSEYVVRDLQVRSLRASELMWRKVGEFDESEVHVDDRKAQDS